MQKKHISYLGIVCIALITVFSGCKKKEKSETAKQPFFSKVKDKHKKNNPAQADENVNAFDLDDEDMKSFALDNNVNQNAAANTNDQKNSEKGHLFSWEQLASDENKEDFKKLFFKFDSYVLEPDQQKDLKFDIKQAKKMIAQGKTLVIEGHACHSAGSAVYNLALSEKRARHVAKHFADAGIDPQVIKIAPRGQEMPLRRGGNREEQAVNRRVEIFAIDK